MAAKKKTAKKKKIATFKHEEDKRRNIPTAEYESMLKDQDKDPLQVAYERRNRDLDPQLVWRGKEEQDLSDLTVQAPPLYIQEKVHPKVLIDDLRNRSESDEKESDDQIDLFSDFNGIAEEATKTEFYGHDQNWTNRMILGDSLQVMSSLAEREGMRGKVQCIYLDPPYGIKFNSNFQWSTTSRDVKDGKADHITREPEQVKAFRDTWRDGIHSYLTYLRDRLTVARDLLNETGSVFVQIGDENVHRARMLMDEVFGEENFISLITFKKTVYQATDYLPNIFDHILWYGKARSQTKVRQIIQRREDRSSFDLLHEDFESIRRAKPEELRNPYSNLLRASDLTSKGASEIGSQPYIFRFNSYSPKSGNHWKTHTQGLNNLVLADRLIARGNTLCFKKYAADYDVTSVTNVWNDTIQSTFASENIYVVQTYSKVVSRCVLMTTDPGDLVLDPTCGSGTTSYVAEQWGRRWITIDTSRVALVLARARIMGARYPYYMLADSRDGQLKEGELTHTAPSEASTYGNIRLGFVLERVPHITLKSIANNTEIKVIWDKFQEKLEPLREQLNQTLGESWQEWEIPRAIDEDWPSTAKETHRQWREQRITRQNEIDASIAAKADFKYLYGKPYEDKSKVRVAGPFTVESISPHRVLGVNEEDELIDGNLAEDKLGYDNERDFSAMILENLKTAGVQQSHKEDRINFTSLTGWPGNYICAEGLYTESDSENAPVRRAGVFIGPEFGTVSRPDLVAAAREAADAGFYALIACAFNYDAHSTDFDSLGRIPVLKARMNADLHMADDLKNTGKGNLFVIFGEPDIDVLDGEDGEIKVKINGVDVFHPQTGEVESDGPDGIACWFIDTDYNEESFFVRHAYFLGANDPYKSLKTTLKAEINAEAWATLNSDTSRSFPKPESGRIAVKVINNLGDEVMKVFSV